jgi:Ca2+-binding RTX toxin-like protein
MYWSLYKDGIPIAELQAMPVDENGNIVKAPVGTLQFFQYSRDPQLAKDLGVLGPIENDRLSHLYDNSIVAYQTDSLQDVMSRWNAASTKIPDFNSLNVPYWFLYENSNTGHRAFGEAMDLPVYDFDPHVTPGLDLKLDSNWMQHMPDDVFRYYLNNWELTDNAVNNTEYYLLQSYQNGLISSSTYSLLTTSISQLLVSNQNTTPNWSSWQNLSLDPIGAFYDSQSATYDQALSIANKTGVLVDSQGVRVSVSTLQVLDTNLDGVLSLAESANLRLMTDVNENGHLDVGELNVVTGAICSVDWGRLTRGNAVLAGYSAAAPTMASKALPTVINLSQPTVVNLSQPSAITLAQPGQVDVTQAVPFSNYRTLRDTDNRYWIDALSWIDWSPGQVKINNGNRNIMIGTDGNDAFDASIYSAYASWFPTPLTQFMGGGGDDLVGGSAGSDTIWGGTGNDTLLGYTGDDKLYGEEGSDTILAQDGNDYLDGGIGDDRYSGLFIILKIDQLKYFQAA